MIRKRLKLLTSQSLVYGFGSLVPRFLGFFLIPIYTRVLTPADYGILSLAIVSISVLGHVFSMGQNGPLRRFYYDFNKKNRKIFIGTIFIFEFIVSFMLSIILTIVGGVLFPIVFTEVPFYPYFLIAIWIVFFSTFSMFPNVLLRMENKPKYFSALSVGKFLLTSTLIIYFVVILRNGALGSLQATLIANALLFLVYIFWLKDRLTLNFNVAYIKNSLKFGLPLIPHALSGVALTFVDRVMLARLTDLTQVGLYTIGYSTGFVLSMVVSSVNLAWSPFFIETVKFHSKQAKDIFTPLITYYFIFTAFLAMIVAIFSKEVLQIITTESFFDAHKIVPIITFSYFFQGMYFMVSSGLFQARRTVLIAITTFSVAVLNFVLNLILIPKYGIVGAAWATAIAFVALFLVAYFLALKFFPVHIEWFKLAVVLVLATTLSIIGFYAPSENFGLLLITKISLVLIYMLVVYKLWLHREFTLRDIRDKIKSYIGKD